MVETRMGSRFLFDKTIEDFSRLQSSLNRARKQLSSGVTTDNFSEMTDRINTVLNLQTARQDGKSYIYKNNLISVRMNTTESSLANIEQVASDFRRQLLLRRSPAGSNVALDRIGNDLLTNIKSSLNAQIDGAYLFGGSRTDSSPIGDILTTNIVGGAITDNYYLGDAVDLIASISSELSITYNIKANDPAFKNLIGAIHKGIKGHQTNDDSLLAESVTLVNTAISELAGLRNRANTNIITVQETNRSHESYNIYLEEKESELIGTDVPVASIQVAQNQTLLQAVFQIFAQISRLKLSDYLK